MRNLAQHSFFIPAGDRFLAATCFVPDAVRGAVLFVPPFAEERKGALPVFCETARSLAERGLASLLFDFSGCGDSSGRFENVKGHDLDADCQAALRALSEAFPKAPLALLGLRTGAALAARLAGRAPRLEACVLWAPVTGPDFFRQLLQRRMVNDMVAYGKAQASRDSLESALRADETVDLDGYAINASFYSWLQQLALPPVSANLFLATGGHDEKRTSEFAAAARTLTRSDLRFPPFWNTVGHVDATPLVHETADWLAAHFANTPAWPASASPPHARAPERELAALTEAPAVRACWDIPEQPPRGGILFLHGWSGDRTGPHRLFVQSAAAWAADGYLCLRPDFAGRGLSDGSAADASIATMTENAQAAYDALRRRLPDGAPVAVVAICSGCKVALSLAARNPDIARLLLWSAESMGSLRSSATGLRKTLHALGTYARKLARPETWRKVFRGKVQAGLVTKALVRHETRSAAEAAREDDALKLFRRCRPPVLFVFGGSDPDAAGSGRAYRDYCRRHAIPHALHVIPHSGHSFYGAAWTRELLEVSDRFLRE